MVNDDHQEGLCLGEPSQTAAASAPVPVMRPCYPTPPPGDPLILAGRSGSVSYGVIAPFPLGPGAYKNLLLPSKSGVSVSPSLMEVL